MLKKISQNGFTLAEVLITLVIVGVIAAITVPSLIAKYQDREIKSRFMKAYSTLSQALRKTNSDMGFIADCYYVEGSIHTDITGGESECPQFFEAFRKNLNIIKICNGNAYAGGCMPEYKGQEKILKEKNPDLTEEQANEQASRRCAGDFSTSNLKTRTAYVLSDGTIFFAYNESWSPIFGVDVNGKKGPNKWGYDVFSFVISKDTNQPYKLKMDFCGMVEKGGRTSEEMVKYAMNNR